MEQADTKGRRAKPATAGEVAPSITNKLKLRWIGLEQQETEDLAPSRRAVGEPIDTD
jgi:hypothetical protein